MSEGTLQSTHTHAHAGMHLSVGEGVGKGGKNPKQAPSSGQRPAQGSISPP